jgi:HTH-type transcriptional regulator/antitoxin HigA
LKKLANITALDSQLSNLPIPPGELLAEVIEELGMSQAELARKTGSPAHAISDVIRGRRALRAEMALKLEQATGVPAMLWLRLEARYRLILAMQVQKAS